MAGNRPLEDTLDTAIEGGNGDDISIADALDIFGTRSFGPILILLGLIAVLPPMGAVPGVPAAVGAIVILFSFQIMIGRDHIWLPTILSKRSISRASLKKARDKTAPWLRWADGLVAERLTWAVDGPATVAAGIVVTLLSLAMIPLEIVPFAVAVPGSAIALVGLALTARDGIVMLTAMALSILSAGLLLWYFVR